MMFSRLCSSLPGPSKSITQSWARSWKSKAKPGPFYLLAVCSLFSFFLLGCDSTQEAPPAPDSTKLVQRGKAIYQTQCIACHHPDPKKPGALGPDVFGSSKALLEARILKAEYPAGYKPKRETHTMVALPQLKYEIDALDAYLNSSEN